MKVKISRDLKRQIKRWHRIANMDLRAVVLDAGEVVAKATISEIQARASWGPTPRWTHCAQYLEVWRSPQNVGVWIPPSEPEAREAYALEYGTEDRAPVPIMHNAISRVQRRNAALFGQTLSAALMKVKA